MMVIGEISFYIVVIALSFVSFRSTFVVFILPLLIFRFITMLGNWTQHAFVCPEDPANDFKNSITCINVKYNHKCWNDGYHLSHHQKPNRHWTEHPMHLVDNKDLYSDNKAVVFDKLDFLQVFWHLMHKHYDKLAEHMVDVNGVYGGKQERIELLKGRTRPIAIKAA